MIKYMNNSTLGNSGCFGMIADNVKIHATMSKCQIFRGNKIIKRYIFINLKCITFLTFGGAYARAHDRFAVYLSSILFGEFSGFLKCRTGSNVFAITLVQIAEGG